MLYYIYYMNLTKGILKNSIGHLIISYLLIVSLLFGVGINIDEKNIRLLKNMYFQVIAVSIYVLYETGNIPMTIITCGIYYYLLYKSKKGKEFYNIKAYDWITDTLGEFGLGTDKF